MRGLVLAFTLGVAFACAPTARAQSIVDVFQSSCGQRFDWSGAQARFERTGWAVAAHGESDELDAMLESWDTLFGRRMQIEFKAFSPTTTHSNLYLVATQIQTRNGIARGCGLYDFTAQSMPDVTVISQWVGREPRTISESAPHWLEWPAPSIEMRPTTLRAMLSTGAPPAAPGLTLIVEWVEPLGAETQ